MIIAAMPDHYNLPEVELKFVLGEKWKTQQDQFSRNLKRDGVLLWKKK